MLHLQQWSIPPCGIQQGAFTHIACEESAQGVLTRAQEIRGLNELVGASQRAPAGYEGVYASGVGFGAELRKGNKRLRQIGFSSAFEAALERARWARAQIEGLHDNAPQRQCAELNPAEDETPQCPSAQQQPPAEMVPHQQAPAEMVPHQHTELAEGAQLTPAEMMVPQQASQALANSTNAECASPPLRQQDSLREKFELHVMCDYTPVQPAALDKSNWVSYKALLRQLEMHAPTEVRKLGAINLKQLITEWIKDHPVFRDLPYSDWCKKLKDHDPLASGRHQVFKFCFKHTPRTGSGTIGSLATVQNASDPPIWIGMIGAGAGLSAAPEVSPSVRETGCSLVSQGGGGPEWEVRPSVRREHVAGNGHGREVLALQSSIQGFQQDVAKRQQQLEQQQQVILPATIQSANISMPSKENNDTVLLRVTWEEPPTRTCYEGRSLPPFTVRLDAENGGGGVPDGIRLRASFLDGRGVVKETKTNGTSALVAGERYAYVAGGRAVWEQLFVCEASSTHHRSFTILIDAIEVTVSGLNFAPCVAHIPHPACPSAHTSLKPSFTLFIPQAPPHVRVPELRSEPLQVTMRHMSRWQHRANDTRSPSDSISQIPGVCCTPQHTPRAFSCTCVSCHVGWRCAVHVVACRAFTTRDACTGGQSLHRAAAAARHYIHQTVLRDGGLARRPRRAVLAAQGRRPTQPVQRQDAAGDIIRCKRCTQC